MLSSVHYDVPVEVVAVSSRVLIQVGLVIFLCRVEGSGGGDGSGDVTALVARHAALTEIPLQFFFHAVCNLHLSIKYTQRKAFRNL